MQAIEKKLGNKIHLYDNALVVSIADIHKK